MSYRQITASKKPNLPALKRKLDRVFNTYIRKRDSNGDHFICISCNKPKNRFVMHAGHFFSAGHNEAVRWDERNVNGQCWQCNTFLHGNLLAYREGMIRKYGLKVLEELEIKRHNKSKMMAFEVEVLIKLYKQKLKQIA